jgi:hypothetical protein
MVVDYSKICEYYQVDDKGNEMCFHIGTQGAVYHKCYFADLTDGHKEFHMRGCSYKRTIQIIQNLESKTKTPDENIPV